jgi:eukaryotic-like serine/threonine-protein kinase
VAKVTTIKLLWGTTWRGGALGLLVGTLGGAAYGALFANGLFAFSLLAQPATLQAKDVPAGIVAIVFLALIGAVVGALFGVPTGFVVGLLDGLLVGVLTRAFFYPLKTVRVYRRTAAVVSALFTGVAAWLCFIAIMLFYADRNAANIGVLIGMVTLPALIAGVGAGVLSRLIAGWYESNLQLPISNLQS